MNKSTEEIQNILKSKKDYSEFFTQQIGELYFGSAAEYLDMLLTEKKTTKSEVIKRGNLDKNYAYQIFNGTKTNPSRNKVLMIAIGMRLNVEETQKLLKMCSLTELYVRLPRDSVILYCIHNEKNIIETNELLSDYKLELLE